MKTSFFTGLICALALAAFPLMAAIPPSGDLKFAVMRSDSDIGRHSVSFERKGDELHVDVAIDLEVSIAFVTVFTYSHRNHEVWKNGRLVSIETTTDDNGDEYSLSGHAVENGFKVDGAAGSFIAPADIKRPTDGGGNLQGRQRKAGVVRTFVAGGSLPHVR